MPEVIEQLLKKQSEQEPNYRVLGPSEQSNYEGTGSKIDKYLSETKDKLRTGGMPENDIATYLVSDKDFILQKGGFTKQDVDNYLLLDKAVRVFHDPSGPPELLPAPIPEQDIIGAIPDRGVISQIVSNMKVALNRTDPQERFDGIFHALDPILDPAAYMIYKAVNGRYLNGPEILMAAAKRSIKDLGQSTDGLDQMTPDETVTWALDYNPSGFVKSLSDLIEFGSAMGKTRSVLGLPMPVGSKLPLGYKMTIGGTMMAVPSMTKQIARQVQFAENPIDAIMEVGRSGLYGFTGGMGIELGLGGIGAAGRTKSAQWAMNKTRGLWQKVVDIPVDYIKNLKPESNLGKFRTFLGEHLVGVNDPEYLAANQQRQGQIIQRTQEVDALVKKFNDITDKIASWSEDPDAHKKMTQILTAGSLDLPGRTRLAEQTLGKDVVAGLSVEDAAKGSALRMRLDLPPELQAWVEEAQQANKESAKELVEYFRAVGKNSLANVIQDNAGTYLPRKFAEYEKPMIAKIWGWLKRPRYGGGEFGIRKDKWTLWEEGKAVGKFETSEDAVAEFEKRIIAQGEIKAAEVGSLGKSLRENLNVGKKIEKVKAGVGDVPETLLPTKKDVSVTYGGKQYTIKPPLSIEQMEKLGVIQDPRYLLANAMVEGKADIENLKFANFVSSKWGVKPPSDMTAKEVSEWAGKQGMVRVPDMPEYGALAGQMLPKTMATDMKILIERPENEVARFLAPYMKLWKMSKTSWNPATHFRNLMGNFVFADFAGTSPWNADNWPYYQKAVKQIISKDSVYQKAVKEGVIGTEYYGTMVEKSLNYTGSADDFFEKFLIAADKASGKAGEVYAAEDQIYKLAAFNKYIDIGMSEKDALKEVNKWFPNYKLLSPITQKIAKSPFGAPFLAFTDQSLKIYLRATREHPIKAAKWMAMPGLVTEFSQRYLGMSPAEKDLIDQSRSYFEPILPGRDNDGRGVTGDWRWTIPLANDLVPNMQGTGIKFPWALQNPFFTSAAQLVTGTNVFTGQPITKEYNSIGRKILDHAIAVSSGVAPLPTVSTYGIKRIYNASKDEFKARETLTRAVVGVLTGINVRAPYIDRQKLITQLRDDVLTGDPTEIAKVAEKIVEFDVTYRRDDQPLITKEGLQKAIETYMIKELTGETK